MPLSTEVRELCFQREEEREGWRISRKLLRTQHKASPAIVKKSRSVDEAKQKPRLCLGDVVRKGKPVHTNFADFVLGKPKPKKTLRSRGDGDMVRRSTIDIWREKQKPQRRRGKINV